jgi:Big-like domain-containing protein
MSAQTTTTELSISSPSPVAEGILVTLTAVVTPTVATGIVDFFDRFFDSEHPLGGPVVVDNGAARTTSLLPTGMHECTAIFAPQDPRRFTTSMSPALPFQATERPGGA